MKNGIRLLETIKIKDGRAFNLPFHQARMDSTRWQLWQQPQSFLLRNGVLPETIGEGCFKWRIIYGKEFYQEEFIPYSPKKIQCLKLVEANDLVYDFKYADRRILEQLRDEKRESCDDIIIVKNGKITDTSFANLVFFDGKDWWTPKKPLLAGTQRAWLLYEQKIKEMEIKPEQLNMFSHCKLINAMIGFEKSPEIKVENLFP